MTDNDDEKLEFEWDPKKANKNLKKQASQGQFNWRVR